MRSSSAYPHTRGARPTHTPQRTASRVRCLLTACCPPVGRLTLATLSDPTLHLILITAALVYLMGGEPWRTWDQ